MTTPISDIAFTPAVKAQQVRMGSRQGYSRMEQKGGWTDQISPDLEAFIAARDSFYFGSASADGRPYIQHRGGSSGFLKVLDDRRLAFADYSGNRQYISVGNLSENSQAFLFLMDYPNRRRIKIWGQAEVVEGVSEVLGRVVDPAYKANPERAIVFHVEAWDSNCPQHIRPRFTEEEVSPILDELRTRIHELESELAAARSALDGFDHR
ncbi:MAG: pyridoxamine 5'-phosphate oxidase family protein [Deltaproteobacteria bacterium]|nr:pyridoxamine 5'-phosphate oxidase family protein [Deltaproteobacteria bacterium]